MITLFSFSKDENVIRDVLLFDKLFTVSCDENVTGMDHGLLIKNDARNLLVKCSSGRQARYTFCLIWLWHSFYVSA